MKQKFKLNGITHSCNIALANKEMRVVTVTFNGRVSRGTFDPEKNCIKYISGLIIEQGGKKYGVKKINLSNINSNKLSAQILRNNTMDSVFGQFEDIFSSNYKGNDFSKMFGKK